MTLRERMKTDLTRAMKEKDAQKKEALRVILGELGRQGKKELTDEDVVRVLKRLLKSEMELLERSGARESAFSAVLEAYLPKTASDEEILQWIGENIDFSGYKDKMQAMGPIMKHFGASADGNRVRQLLLSL